MTATSQECPSCGATVPRDEGYSPWCHVCGWNVGEAQDALYD